LVRCLHYYLKFSNFADSILIYRGIILLNIFFSKRDLTDLEGQTWEIRWFEHHGIRASRNIILTWGWEIFMKLSVKLATLMLIIFVNFHYNPFINDRVSTNSTPKYQKTPFSPKWRFSSPSSQTRRRHRQKRIAPKTVQTCSFQGRLFFRLSCLSICTRVNPYGKSFLSLT